MTPFDLLSGLLLVLAVGALPMVVYATILLWFDHYEKEPLLLVIAALLWGAIPAIILSLIAELVLDIPVKHFVKPGLATDLLGAAVIAPVVEEICKWAALLLLAIIFPREIESPLDGIIYGGLIGFGFAAVENGFYLYGEFLNSGPAGVVGLAMFRSLAFGLNHALFTGMAGLGLSLARTSGNWFIKLITPWVGLMISVTAHAVHNGSVVMATNGLWWMFLVAALSDWGGALTLLGVIILLTLRERRWIEHFLRKEVQQGTITH